MDAATKSRLKEYIYQSGIKCDYKHLHVVDAQIIKAIYLEENLHDFIGDAIAYRSEIDKSFFKEIAKDISMLEDSCTGVHLFAAVYDYLTRIDFIGQVNELIKECNE